MNIVRISIVLLLSILIIDRTSVGQDNTRVLEGPYLGQESPGLIPELFAPGVVSTTDLEVEGAFAPSMTEFYFLRLRLGERPKNYVIQSINGLWQEPVERPSSEGEVFISTDGNTMHLGNKYRKRTDSGWSEEESLGPPYEGIPIMRLTASSAGTYVFDERDEVGTIRYSRLIEGEREEPRAFGEEINTGKWTAHPFIAPDESYLIWDSERDGGFGQTDLYISFRRADGSWGPAINMGEDINTEYEDTYGSVTPDGNYFLFQIIDLNETNPSANIFWVDAQVIENLRLEQ